MKFSTREDIDAPIEDVFDELCKYEVYERQAIRRGAEVRRHGSEASLCAAMTWDVSFMMRGKTREMTLVVDQLDRPNQIGVNATSKSLDAAFSLELISLSRTRTRMMLGLELKPKNLSARLLVQSLKLAKASLTKRFKLRVAEFTRGVEQNLRKSA